MDIDYHKLPLRYILCIDVKSFFASVEAVRRGLDPLDAYIIVVSDLNVPGAVILASSPKVKSEFGIKTGNRLFEVPKDEKLILVEPSMQLYLDINRKIHKIFSDFAADEDILVYSIDEAFIDVTSTMNILGNPWEIALLIKEKIKKELGLVVTIGIGDNPLLAKLALDNSAKSKQSQIAYWSYGTIPQTVWKIKKLTDFWGINKGYEERLSRLGINSVYTLAHYPKEILYEKFGIIGLQHFYHANGVDYTLLSERIKPKTHSYSKGQVLPHDYNNKNELLIILSEMVEEVASRLRKNNMVCKEIHLYARLSKYENEKSFSKSKAIAPTSSSSHLKDEFISLFNAAWKNESIRQFNISCNKVTDDYYEQLDLFSSLKDEKYKKLDDVLDSIKGKHGKTSVFKGYNLMDGSTFFERAKKVGGHTGKTEV